MSHLVDLSSYFLSKNKSDILCMIDKAIFEATCMSNPNAYYNSGSRIHLNVYKEAIKATINIV